MREEFGKLLNYTVDENIVSIAYEKNDAYVKVITKNIVNFFVPKVSKERKSKAIEYLDNNKILVKYSGLAKSVTPGQACVLYLEEECLGCGFISEVYKNNEKLWYL